MTFASTAPQPALSRAVLVGTSDYERQDRLPNLPAVSNNLVDLRQALTRPDTGVLARDACVVVDSPDSAASFMSRLSREASKAEDLLLVYYAGHGLRHETRDLLYLGVRGTDPDNLAASAVSYEDVREVVERSPARVKLVILDCCYSGLAIGTMSGDVVDTREIRISGTSVITSVPRNKRALSPPGERHTVFTGELIHLLENGHRLPGQSLTVRTLYGALHAAMSRREMPKPKLASFDSGIDLLLRREPPPPPPDPAPLFVPSPPVAPPSEPVVLPPVPAASLPAAGVSVALPEVVSPSAFLPPVLEARPEPTAKPSYLRQALSLSASLQVGFFGSVYIALAAVMDVTTGTSTNQAGAFAAAVLMSILSVLFGGAWLLRRRMRVEVPPLSGLDASAVRALRAIWVAKVVVLALLSLSCLIAFAAMITSVVNPAAMPSRAGAAPASAAVDGVIAAMFAHAAIGCVLSIVRNVRQLNKVI